MKNLLVKGVGGSVYLAWELAAVALAAGDSPCQKHQRGSPDNRWCYAVLLFQQLVPSRSRQIKSRVESTHI